MTSYDVGQIIYVVSSKKMQVIPFVIAEEVVRKTLAGKEVTYLVKRDSTNKTYNLNDLQGEVFEDIEDVRRSLVDNATAAIDKICTSAKKRSISLQVRKVPDEQPGVKIPSDDDIKSFVLEDGTKVNLTLPDM
tara:strand:- start:125 stop:523 length:399 start_codon:yes stop_codon:yes gene_type:complete